MCAALAAVPPFVKLRRMRKDGHAPGRQAYHCGGCGRRCVPGGPYSRPSRAVKEQRAIAMYAEGSSLSAIGRVLGYSAPAVLGWVKKGACRTEATAGAQPAADRGPGWASAGGGDCR